MKHVFICLTAAAVFSLGLFSCSDAGNKSAGAASADEYAGPEVSLNEKLENKIGDWVEKGTECYGIVVAQFQDGRTVGKSVKCKVMSLGSDKVKMKALEKVSLMESIGCDALGLSYGDTWWETDGDLFKTREEADAYLFEKGWLVK